MASLNRNLRGDLESAVEAARRAAEAGATKALERLTVGAPEAWPKLGAEEKKLRNRLRAHGRQLGDRRDERGAQRLERLIGECAYEHWHRLLFARFLAENDLLIEPESGMALSLVECRELARERGSDWLPLASGFAERMLPQIFRAGDPVLDVALPPETRQELERILESLPSEVFRADDSLGWVYQFWQAEEKERVNKSEKKIGAEELPAVTQLFTEDYMVLFLLHNTLGAWWAGKYLAAHPEVARAATSEEELRLACGLPGCTWTYLRFVRDEGGVWRPAAGAFEGWPHGARDVTLLDPCMGSGHFLVFALPIVVAFRVVEEGLSIAHAVQAVLRDNLFGLEIDPRCTQIAAFNLALAAWRLGGHQALPPLNLACSGLGVNAREADWVRLAGDDARLQETMRRLYELFQQAPTLGSLIDPRRIAGELFTAEFDQVRPLLERALAAERTDEQDAERAVAAQGLVAAAQLLAGHFTLVATNVPYLGRGKQDEVLKEYCSRAHASAETNIATCSIDRSLAFNPSESTIAVVTPQSWLFQGMYKGFRKKLLRGRAWNVLATLGPGAFETITGEVVNVALLVFSNHIQAQDWTLVGFDATPGSTPVQKAEILRESEQVNVNQLSQLSNPDAKIVFGFDGQVELLSRYAKSFQGIKTGDDERVQRFFWEIATPSARWRFLQSTVTESRPFGGLESVIDWKNDGDDLARKQGIAAWGRRGVMVSQMSGLPVSLFMGDLFDSNASPIVPDRDELVLAVWLCCSAPSYREDVRTVDPSLKPTNASLVQVPFDLAQWQKIAAEKFPDGLPKPHSDDPTQWLFDGHPRRSRAPLQVAVARLLGYRWPRQTGSSFPDCPALGPDGLEEHVDADGIVCLSALRGEASAADQLGKLLASAYGSEWSASKQNELLASVGFAGKSLDEWLRDGFFEQHCALFHTRPFVWHVWDGLKNGFGALVNYHKLAGPGGTGRRTLEKLIYTYLGDWIDRQREAQTKGTDGADARVVAAEHLKRGLEKILEGEPPYDIFVRWKPLHEQPVGWEPDLNDGVRMNIRPFMSVRPLGARAKSTCILCVTPKIKWEKDRGKEPARPKDQFPWFWSWDEQAENFAGSAAFDGNRWNDLHYTRAFKLAARERQAREGAAR